VTGTEKKPQKGVPYWNFGFKATLKPMAEKN
jgi:hypothetical protein